MHPNENNQNRPLTPGDRYIDELIQSWEMDPNENNENRPLTTGDRRCAILVSPPLPGDQTNIPLSPAFRRPFQEMNGRIASEEIRAREELGIMSHCNLPPRLPPDQTIKARYWLGFRNKVIKHPTFTDDVVRADSGDPIEVAIVDTHTQSIISPDCSLSSTIVRLTVLDAEFWKNKGKTWSRSEFNQSMLRERDGKGPILTGRNLTIQLENGVGTFKNIIFKDNSSWTKSGFRLAVMVEGDGEEGHLNGVRVQEGVSEPFRVKDRRVKVFQKPDRLTLKHGVRFIKKIGKIRASSLKKKNIISVEDFLHCYFNNEPELRNILCIRSESGKEWDSIVEHVKPCADQFQAKCNASNNSSQPRQSLVDPMERNMSLGTNGGHRVVSLGSSEPNPSENNIIQDISTICDEPIVETQNPVFPENGYSVQHTYDGGFPPSELLFGMFNDLDMIMDDTGNPDIIMGVSGGGNGSDNYGGSGDGSGHYVGGCGGN